MSNPNSSIDFFKNHLKKIPTLINEFKQAMEDINAPVKSETLYLFMNVLYEICRKENLLDEYLKSVQTENNRVAKSIDNIYIIKHVEIPTTIVECGFLSNPEEEKKLLDNDYQDKLAWGIYNGIINYFL